MMELTISGKVYQFKFGMGFMRDLNRQVSAPVDGLKDISKNIGLRYKLSGLFDGDVEDLVDVLDCANKGFEPRVTRDVLDEYIDDENTDINELFETVMDFLSKANATRRAMEDIKREVEKQQKNQ